MDPLLANLLLLYAAAVLINNVTSVALFLERRDPLTRGQMMVWAATFGALVAQMVAGPVLPGVLFGLASVFGVSAAVANVIGFVAERRPPWRLYGGLFAAGLVASLVMHFAHAPFIVTTLPVLVGVAFPILSSAATMLVRDWRQLSMSGRFLGIASILYGLHMLDFSVLGDKPNLATFGFTLSLVSVFALSMTMPVVVVEKITAQTARSAAEMDAARRIQLDLLPKSPVLSRLELACYAKPAEEVGGDYYDMHQIGDRAWILLGDVTGHGLSSGLVMLMAQSIIASILEVRQGITPAELNVLTNRILNHNLRRMNEDRTMTIVSMCFENQNEVVLSGSHDNIFVHRCGSGEVETIEVSQFPFGLGFIDEVTDADVTEVRYQLQDGDTLFIITDGVTEAASQGDYKKGMYSEERLVAFIKATAGQPLERIRDSLVAQLEEYTAGIFHDDVTFVIARLGPA